MSEEIRIIVPKPIAEAIRKRAESLKLSVDELIIRAIAKIIEEEIKR